jgi:hypothetical protein
MKKTNICISVDVDTLMIAKTKVNNVSKYLNECLAGATGKTEEDRTKEQIEQELSEIKTKMQELSIKQSIALQSIKDIEASKQLKAKELLELEQYKRWKCPVCMMLKKETLNYMDQARCSSCNSNARDSPKTVIMNIKGLDSGSNPDRSKDL